MIDKNLSEESRLPWTEPTIGMLEIRETSQNPGKGGDYEYTLGNNTYPDCTRS